jgi:hypothetical protein
MRQLYAPSSTILSSLSSERSFGRALGNGRRGFSAVETGALEAMPDLPKAPPPGRKLPQMVICIVASALA